MNINLSFVFEIALKSTLILTAAFGLAHLLRHASASARHLLWITAIVGILALPTLSRITPAWTAAPPAVKLTTAILHVADAPAAGSPVTTTAAPFNAIPWIWISGSLVVLARLLTGVARTRQIARAATPIE